MSYTLSLLTTEARDLVVEALRAEAGKRTRVAQGAALAVADDRAAKRDVRAASVKVTALLAEAGRLDQLATELATAPEVPLLVQGPHVPQVAASAPTHGDPATTAEPDDDGLSDAAHAAMEQAEEFADAYLEDPDGTDVDTHAIGEDEPADDDVEEVLK